ncbi:hypothetical protein EXIGLDRAFT_829273 [Exidia glandulosa HHB12029]|uniref:Uncharacterized protein n=1 Tax=Exidia glandulosa HHB12029 TaxID=1314781 RepID=A0A165PMC4_EXIGL|nr:hypothetical protein EXIGLDRAFT_829273 [Exidia glandulosa HHB12029]
MSLTPYTVVLTAASPLFQYLPFRDGSDLTTAWSSSYTGAPQATGAGFRQTELIGASLSLAFEGTEFWFCFTPNGAHYDLVVDGKPADTAGFKGAAGTPCKDAGAEAIFIASSLDANKAHNVSLTITSLIIDPEPFQFFGGGFTMGLKTGGKVVDNSTLVDDQDSSWVFVPGRVPAEDGWDTTTNPVFDRNSATFICPYGPGGSASYNFTGAAGIIFKGYLWPDVHAFSIQLDDKTYNLDGSTSFFDNSTVFLAQGGLDPSAVHKISLMNYNSDQPDCITKDALGNTIGGDGRYCCVGFDSLVILKPGSAAASGTPTSTSGGSTNTQSQDNDGSSNGGSGGGRGASVGPIVGGVLGGLAFGVLAFVLFMYLRRKRRTQAAGAYAYSEFRPPDVYMDDYAPKPWTDGTVTSHSAAGSKPDITAPYVFASATNQRSSDERPQPRPQPTPQRSAQNLNPLKAAAGPPPPGHGSGASGSGQRLADEDLQRVLAFVAQRMDPVQNTSAQNDDQLPPRYSRS